MTWGMLWAAARTLALTTAAQAVWLALTAAAVLLASRDKDKLELEDTWW